MSDEGVSHIQFADDTLFIGDMTWDNIVVMKIVLRWFEVISGLKVVFFKSKLAVVHGNDSFASDFADLLNCKRMSLPFTYLGIEVGASPKKSATWSKVIEKIQRMLTRWKLKNISFGGRIC